MGGETNGNGWEAVRNKWKIKKLLIENWFLFSLLVDVTVLRHDYTRILFLRKMGNFSISKEMLQM